MLRKALAAICAFLAACLWALADFIYGAGQPRNYGNVSEYSPEGRRVIEALRRGERAKAPTRE